MEKKVCVFLADGFEEIEGLTVVDLLRRAGIFVTTVSITGKLQIRGSHDICVQADKLFEEMDFLTYIPNSLSKRFPVRCTTILSLCFSQHSSLFKVSPAEILVYCRGKHNPLHQCHCY